jgi:hypothetical protein
MAFKIGAGNNATANVAAASLFIYRSVDNTGAPTADAVACLFNTYNATGSAPTSGVIAFIDYNNSAAISTGTTTNWAFVPSIVTSTLVGTNGQVFPVIQRANSSSAPFWGFSNALALCIFAEVATNATTTMTLIGNTSLTYINVGAPHGNGEATYASATFGLLMLWQ